MSTNLPDWLTVGAWVRQWNGRDEPGAVRTVERFTATQIVMVDGSRWHRDNLTKVGQRFSAPLHPADSPELLACADAHRRARDRKSAAWGVEGLGPRWGNNPSEENAQALRDAIVRLAPHLGLTVTVDADQCQYRDRHDEKCLLLASHADAGEWHRGLGWSASLGRTYAAMTNDQITAVYAAIDAANAAADQEA